ncbi:MAG: PIN domain-containing protein [Euryarchaeota archaeon]|nr:PIN domain-containing protein [Euryarchaeota archaeon]
MFLDTSVLVEHFQATPLGKRVDQVIARENCAASIVSVAELCAWCLTVGRDPTASVSYLHELVAIEPLEETACISAARLYREHREKAPKFGLVDALILATARERGETLLSCDNDFRGLEGVEVWEG